MSGQKNQALRIAAKAFLAIHYGSQLSKSEAKTLADLCCLALPVKERFSQAELDSLKKSGEPKIDPLAPATMEDREAIEAVCAQLGWSGITCAYQLTHNPHSPFRRRTSALVSTRGDVNKVLTFLQGELKRRDKSQK